VSDLCIKTLESDSHKVKELFGYAAFYFDDVSNETHFIGIKTPLNSAMFYVVPYVASKKVSRVIIDEKDTNHKNKDNKDKKDNNRDKKDNNRDKKDNNRDKEKAKQKEKQKAKQKEKQKEKQKSNGIKKRY
jgi:hypothetical protein